ncbi:MAG: demethoxyubiquinone hydroxylase family protein [Anaerolineales bacterium]|nr:demethoxyubiquinone hydroxylase family protein [Anaerolineales bacterium]
MKEIERILKLDHAGEYGAINIYSAQLLIARLFYKDIVSKLEVMLSHEEEHYKTFNNLLITRSMHPFSVINLWAVGGFAMGLATAIIGHNAIWVCTDAVETTVLYHLEWQLNFLKEHDLEVHAAVSSIIADKELHQEFGQSNGSHSLIYKPVFFIIKKSTEFAIWISRRL